MQQAIKAQLQSDLAVPGHTADVISVTASVGAVTGGSSYRLGVKLSVIRNSPYTPAPMQILNEPTMTIGTTHTTLFVSPFLSRLQLHIGGGIPLIHL